MITIVIMSYITLSLVIGIIFCEGIRQGKCEHDLDFDLEGFIGASPANYLLVAVLMAAIWPLLAIGTKVRAGK